MTSSSRTAGIINKVLSDLIRRNIKSPYLRFTLGLLLLFGFYLLKSQEPRTKKQLETENAKVVFVIDGDTLLVKQNQKDLRVRLIGIDAPEIHENEKALRDSQRSGKSVQKIIELGQRSKANLERIVHRGDNVRLVYDVSRTDQYGRLLAYVYVGENTFVNLRMAAEGYASPVRIKPNIKYAEEITAAYKEAQRKQLGLYSK